MYYVYILYSKEYNRTYVGQTRAIERRILEHNTGKNKSTLPYLPWQIIHQEIFKTREEAIDREKYLKTSAGRRFIKNKLFDSQNNLKEH